MSRVKLCLVSVFPDLVKDCPKIRNLPEIFIRSFENVSPVFSIAMMAQSALQAVNDVLHRFTTTTTITTDYNYNNYSVLLLLILLLLILHELLMTRLHTTQPQAINAEGLSVHIL